MEKKYTFICNKNYHYLQLFSHFQQVFLIQTPRSRSYTLSVWVITARASQTTKSLSSSWQYESQPWWENHWLPANPSSEDRVPQPCYYSPPLSPPSLHPCLLMGLKETTVMVDRHRESLTKSELWAATQPDWGEGGKDAGGWCRNITE